MIVAPPELLSQKLPPLLAVPRVFGPQDRLEPARTGDWLPSPL
jgi:hypothetical protein